MDEDDKIFFYWIDAVDRFDKMDISSHTVRMFGRIKTTNGFESCSVIVSNVYMTAYAKPRDKISDAMKRELDTFAVSHGMNIIKSKPVQKNFAFKPRDLGYGSIDLLQLKLDVGDGQKYLAGASGDTFSHILVSHSRPVETLIIKRRIMGPEWLVLLSPKSVDAKKTWCTHEYSIDSPSDVIPLRDAPEEFERLEPPPLNIFEFDLARFSGSDEIASIGIRTRVGHLLRSEKQDEDAKIVVCASSRTGISKDDEQIEVVDGGEKGLCETFANAIVNCEPDIVIAKNVIDSMRLISSRSKATSAKIHPRFGRIKGFFNNAGIVLCDFSTVVGELVHTPLRSHSVRDVAYTVLGSEVTDRFVQIAHPDVTEGPIGNVDVQKTAAASCAVSIELAWMSLAKLGALELTLDMTNISGNLWRRTLDGRRSERNDYLLMHKFHERGFALPDHPDKREFSKRKSAYTGGLVIKPKCGLWSKTHIAVIDFTSMYPSIICGLNICHTTKTDASSVVGIIPTILKDLLEKRRAAKQAAVTKGARYEIRQLALKLVANEIYGCLGFDMSAFCDIELASRVTEAGRTALTKAKSRVENLGYDVIYGDTDSMMIDTRQTEYKEAMDIAEKIAVAASEACGVIGMRMIVDGIYRSVLLVSKKKYAALDARVDRFVFKGLDMVRRDWCINACVSSRRIAELLLKTSPSTRIEDIGHAIEDIATKQDSVGWDEYVITRQLKKDIKEYGNDLRALPHVRAAIKMQRRPKRGDFISYIIRSTDEPNMPGTRMSLHPSDHSQPIDVAWYIEKQIIPMISRICQSVEGLGGSFVSEHFASHSTIKITPKRRISIPKKLDIVKDIIEQIVVPPKNPLHEMLIDEINVEEFHLTCRDGIRRKFSEMTFDDDHLISKTEILEQFDEYVKSGVSEVYLRNLVDVDFITRQSGSREKQHNPLFDEMAKRITPTHEIDLTF